MAKLCPSSSVFVRTSDDPRSEIDDEYDAAVEIWQPPCEHCQGETHTLYYIDALDR